MDKVLVTGANGHLGATLTGLLIEKGYNVRASVRNLNDRSKTRHLQKLKVELVEADLMKPGTLRKAMDGVNGLFQVAAVYKLWAKNPNKEMPCGLQWMRE
jgi:dihydroflavonol-4-reductase